MSDWKQINSSNLEAAKFDAATATLFVKFKSGAVYKYPNFSATLHANFQETFSGENGKSAGKFFNANIRHLPNEKVEE